MKNKPYYIALLAMALLAIAYMAGPQPNTPVYTSAWPQVDFNITQADSTITHREEQLQLKKDNDARIVWAHRTGQPTEYVILYLPGFSATRMEGEPVHRHVASRLGANLFLARMAYHGFTKSHLGQFTAEGIWQSAKQQLAIAEKLGKKVIIMGTSTGATLGLMLAAKFPDKVYALINISPNIRVNNGAAFILNNPWGAQVATLLFGKDGRRVEHKQEEAKQYWDTIYPVQAVVQLQELLETAMVDSTFAQVSCPALSLYYYKDENHQDEVIDVRCVRQMHAALATPDSLKVLKALATPGDHVMGSYIKSDNYEVVQEAVLHFAENVLHIRATTPVLTEYD